MVKLCERLVSVAPALSLYALLLALLCKEAQWSHLDILISLLTAIWPFC